MPDFRDVDEFKSWFESHVSLYGKPYTIDRDQARAVLDTHKNALITARAGSGKTRVIVAKIAYLVISGIARLDQIVAFMFNRTAAAEVNERIAAVSVDGVTLGAFSGNNLPIRVASTFHKFALDTVKRIGERPEIITELEHDKLIRRATDKVLQDYDMKLPRRELEESLKLIGSFVSRAGQKYPGEDGLAHLCSDVDDYLGRHAGDASYSSQIRLHRLALNVYREYLIALNFPEIDFNILMFRAAELLKFDNGSRQLNQAQLRIAPIKYILVDEYQDFSFLFFNLIRAIRTVCPKAHLFAVGDDWQAINRFAGSDVDYFLGFAKFFPEDVANIPLVTNYRSDRKIVENANRYMLTNYNPEADKAVAFSKKFGKIKRLNPSKTKFDSTDLYEDALHDATYQLTLAEICGGRPENYIEAAKLLKTVTKIIKKHRREGILFLHRHNFMSFANVTLDNFLQALKIITTTRGIMDDEKFETQIRCMTMHKSKGLESDVVILLEANREMILSSHPHATIFEIFGDTLAAEKSDQHRLLYVALTRAKHRLYILSSDKKCPV